MSSASSNRVDRPIRLALLEHRTEDAEWLLSSLRNEGISSRAHPGDSLPSLTTLLDKEEIDVVVVGQGWTGFTLSQAAQAAGSRGVSVVFALSSLTSEAYAKARLDGADDVYVRGMPSLACQVVVAQYQATQLRRESLQAKNAVADTDKRVDALMGALTEPLAYLNEGLHVKANQAYLDLLGMASFEDLEGLSLLDVVSKESQPSLREKIKQLGRGQSQAEDLQIHLLARPESPAHLHLEPAYYDGEPCLQATIRLEESLVGDTSGGLVSVGLAAPIAQSTLDEWMKKDPATGLFNRLHMVDIIAQAKEGSLWLIQVDHHEQVLNTIGISQLDALVASLGQRLSELTGSEGVVGRWTANSLAVVVPGEDAEAQAWAKTVQSGVAAAYLELSGRSLPVTISLGGVALGAGLTHEEVLQHASRLLAQALRQTQAVVYFDPLGAAKTSRQQQEQRIQTIQQAVKDNRLFLLFQPIVSFVDGRPCYEALVRLRTSEDQVEAPSEFMPAAEEQGVAEDIDRWVLDAVLEKMADRKRQGKNPGLLVKLSTSSIRSGALISRISDRCQSLGLSPGDLWVELPFSAAVSYAREARAVRDELVRIGCHVVLSGLPTDPGALRMVSLMDPEWVKTKIDAVVGLGASEEKQLALKVMVQAIHQDRRRVLAGFVEDAASLSVLFTLGVDAMEGNFISIPLRDTNFDFSQFGF